MKPAWHPHPRGVGTVACFAWRMCEPGERPLGTLCGHGVLPGPVREGPTVPHSPRCSVSDRSPPPHLSLSRAPQVGDERPPHEDTPLHPAQNPNPRRGRAASRCPCRSGAPPAESRPIFAKPNTAQEEPRRGCGQGHGPMRPVSGPGPLSWSSWPSLRGLPGSCAQALGPSSGDLCQGEGVRLGGEAQASKVAAPQYFWITPNPT